MVDNHLKKDSYTAVYKHFHEFIAAVTSLQRTHGQILVGSQIRKIMLIFDVKKSTARLNLSLIGGTIHQ